MSYFFNTKLGWIGVRLQNKKITDLTFGHSTEEKACDVLGKSAARIAYESQKKPGVVSQPDLPTLKRLEKELKRFAAGESVDFDWLEVSLLGRTDFQQRVLNACRKIKWGETKTYGELAEQSGSPRAARAVGGVMADNCVPLIIPCHRVLARDGKLVGFSATGGVKMKERLLQNENRK